MTMDTARRYRVPSSSSPYGRASSENSGCFLVSVGSSPITAPHFLPKRIRCKGPSLHRVSATSPVLFPSPTPARTSTRRAVVSRDLTCGTGLPRCIKHFPDMPSSIPRWIRTSASIGCFPVLLRPSPNIGRVGFHDFTFEACSRFTRVTACRFAATRMVYFCPRASAVRSPCPSVWIATELYRQLLGRNFHPLALYTLVLENVPAHGDSCGTCLHCTFYHAQGFLVTQL